MQNISIYSECLKKINTNTSYSPREFSLKINEYIFKITSEVANIILDETRNAKAKEFVIDINDRDTYYIFNEFLSKGYFKGEGSKTSIEDLFNIGIKLNFRDLRMPLLDMIGKEEITEDNFIQYLEYYTKSKDCAEQIDKIIDFIVKNFYKLPTYKLLLIDNFDLYERIITDKNLKVKSIDQLAYFVKELIMKSTEYYRFFYEINWIKCPENVREEIFDVIREQQSDDEDFCNLLKIFSRDVTEKTHQLNLETNVSQDNTIPLEIPDYTVHILLGISVIFNVILFITLYFFYNKVLSDDEIRLRNIKTIAPTTDNFFLFYQNIALFASHGFKEGIQFAVDYLQTLRNQNGQDLLHYAATINNSELCIILDQYHFSVENSGDNIINVFLNAGNRKGIEYFGRKYRALLNNTEKIGSHADRSFIEHLKVKYNLVPGNNNGIH